MLAAKIPADIHQFDCVESTVTAPRSRCRMCAFTTELIFHRNKPVLSAASPGHIQVVADVREKHDVNVLEHPCAHVVSLRSDQLFGNTGPDTNGAFQVFAF